MEKKNLFIHSLKIHIIVTYYVQNDARDTAGYKANKNPTPMEGIF